MDSRVPKTEREHAAAREIERLRAALAENAMRRLTDVQQEIENDSFDKQPASGIHLGISNGADRDVEAMTDVQQEMDCYGDGNVYRGQRSSDSKTATLTIKDNLTVEPVAYVTGYSKGRCIIEAVDPDWLLPVGMALYRSPTINEMETVEPVAWRTKNANPPGGYVVFQQYPSAVANLGGEIEPLYAAPPRRKPLTDEEIAVTAAACNSLESEFLVDFARAIEKAHDIGGKE
jgi:hypothetical protein